MPAGLTNGLGIQAECTRPALFAGEPERCQALGEETRRPGSCLKARRVAVQKAPRRQDCRTPGMTALPIPALSLSRKHAATRRARVLPCPVFVSGPGRDMRTFGPFPPRSVHFRRAGQHPPRTNDGENREAAPTYDRRDPGGLTVGFPVPASVQSSASTPRVKGGFAVTA